MLFRDLLVQQQADEASTLHPLQLPPLSSKQSLRPFYRAMGLMLPLLRYCCLTVDLRLLHSRKRLVNLAWLDAGGS